MHWAGLQPKQASQVLNCREVYRGKSNHPAMLPGTFQKVGLTIGFSEAGGTWKAMSQNRWLNWCPIGMGLGNPVPCSTHALLERSVLLTKLEPYPKHAGPSCHDHHLPGIPLSSQEDTFCQKGDTSMDMEQALQIRSEMPLFSAGPSGGTTGCLEVL